MIECEEIVAREVRSDLADGLRLDQGGFQLRQRCQYTCEGRVAYI